MVSPLRVDGIDLSHFQAGALDFARAKAGGLRFVCHKATEGTSYVDARYAQRRREVAAAGLPFGGYHFARPGSSSGAAQAASFLKVCAPKPGDLRPMLDLEDRAGLSASALTKWVGEFIAVVAEKTGVKPIIYTPFDLDDTFGCPLWVARYSNSNTAPRIPKPWVHAMVRQFSNGQFGVPNQVAGIGHCDLNTLPSGPTTLVDLLIPISRPASAPVSPVKEPAPVTAPTGKVDLGHDTSGRRLIVDATWLAKLRAAETLLNYRFTIIKGSYLNESDRSAGTHNGGGAGDLRTRDIPKTLPMTRILTALRQCGLLAWYRPQAAFPDHEIHALDYGSPLLSPQAKAQEVSYRAGRNGLANNGPDDGPRVTIPTAVPSPAAPTQEEDDMADPQTQQTLADIKALVVAIAKDVDAIQADDASDDRVSKARHSYVKDELAKIKAAQ